jgi:hypothetical protein
MISQEYECGAVKALDTIKRIGNSTAKVQV